MVRIFDEKCKKLGGISIKEIAIVNGGKLKLNGRMQHTNCRRTSQVILD